MLIVVEYDSCVHYQRITWAFSLNQVFSFESKSQVLGPIETKNNPIWSVLEQLLNILFFPNLFLNVWNVKIFVLDYLPIL